MSACSQIKVVDPQAGLICQEITKHYPADANNLPDSASVYKTAIEIALHEAKANFERLKKTPHDQKFELHSPWLLFLTQKTSLKLAFVFDNLNKNNNQDIELLKQIAAHQNELSNLKGLKFFVSKTLGMNFNFVDKNFLALHAVQHKTGDCLDYVNLFYGISVLVEHPVKPIDEFGPDGYGNHVLVEESGTFLDPQEGILKHPPRLIQFIDPLKLASLYHYNKAFSSDCMTLKTKNKIASCQWPHINEAKKLAPDYYRVLYDWGRLNWEYLENKSTAIEAIQRTHQLNPDYQPAIEALKSIR